MPTLTKKGKPTVKITITKKPSGPMRLTPKERRKVA